MSNSIFFFFFSFSSKQYLNVNFCCYLGDLALNCIGLPIKITKSAHVFTSHTAQQGCNYPNIGTR